MSTIAIIGGGPRGISVLERIAAQMGAHPDGPPTTVHLIDDTEPGAGRVWRTDQTRTLCMNTLADAVTLFTEPGSSVTAPVIEGPTMYEWAQLIRGDVLEHDADPRGNKTSLFRAHPAMVRGEFHSEIASTLPESHPSRALYGEYLRWVLSTVLSRLPESMEVRIHQARAISVNPVICDDGVTRDRIGLSEQSSGDATSDGTDHLFADATIIAPGWTANEPDALEQFTGASVEMHPKLTWVRPENPADQGVSDPTILPAGQEVLVRGLGMGFFDVMAMVTIDRGGKFVPDSSTRSGLRYRPSGREPRLVVASHHGYPYQPKPVLHALPSAAPTPRLQQVLTQITQEEPAGSIDFGATLWPAIIRDAQAAYYSTLLGGTCPGHDANPEALVSIIALVDDPAIDPWNFHTHPAVVELIPDHADRFNLPFYANPVAQFSDNAASSVTLASSVTSETFTAWIGDRLSEDLHEARLGRDSAVKAGLQVIGAVRKAAAIVDQPGRFTLRSRRAEYAELRRVGQMVGSGPPAFRTAELLCLIDSGHVRFLGAHPTVVIDPEKPAFAMSSPTTGDTPVYSQTLVDAWLHTPDARVSADPLTKQLREEGRLRLFTLSSPDTPEAPSGRSFTESSNPVTTTSPEVDLATGLLVHPDGTLDERVHLLGIPLLNFRADMTISPMPRTDPLMLQETDAAAVSALSIASQSQSH